MATSKQVSNWRKRTKLKLVQVHGGKCIRCGYNKCIWALQFHHRDPKTKKFKLGSGNSYSLAKQVEEAKKCDLLCANCHIDLHSKFIDL